MRVKIYSIWDNVAETHTIPFFMHNDGPAIRAFRDMCVDPTHQFGKNPKDYALYCLGEFEDASGEMHSVKTHLVNGSSFGEEQAK